MKINNLAEAYGHYLNAGDKAKADLAMACAQQVLSTVIPHMDQIPKAIIEAGLTGPEAMSFYESNAAVPAFANALQQAKDGLASLISPSPLH